MYLSKVDLPLHSDHALLDFFAFAHDFFVFACQVSLLSFFFFSICLLYSISTKEIESNTLDLCSGRGSCGSFVHVDLESNTLDLGFGANITHLIQRTRRRRRNFFFASGFGFASRDGNRGVDLVLLQVCLVLQVTSQSGYGFVVGLFFFFFSFFLLRSSSSPSFCFVLLLCSSCSFLKSVKLNEVHETQVLSV